MKGRLVALALLLLLATAAQATAQRVARLQSTE
jgi:hypothetical protein